MRKIATRTVWFVIGFASALGALKLVEELDEMDMQHMQYR